MGANLANKYRPKQVDGIYGYIYKTTNLVNGKIYVGKKTGEFDSNYLGSGRYLNNAINKYGRLNFNVIVIDYAVNLSDLNNKEIFWISFYRSHEFEMYNISKGGDGGNTFLNLTESDRQARINKIKLHGYFSTLSKSQSKEMHARSVASRKRNAELRGYWFTEETRRHMSDGQKNKAPLSEAEKSDMIKRRVETRKRNGYHHSFETIEKIRQANVGRIVSEETRKKLSTAKKGQMSGNSNPFYGKHHSDDVKKLISEYCQSGICGGKGRKWMNNGVKNIRVRPEDIDMYIDDGYSFGRLPFAKKGKYQ